MENEKAGIHTWFQHFDGEVLAFAKIEIGSQFLNNLTKESKNAKHLTIEGILVVAQQVASNHCSIHRLSRSR